MEKIKVMKETTFPIPTYEEWKMEAEKSLKGEPFEKLVTDTYEGITLKPIYTKLDMEDSYNQYPGFPSFVRGTSYAGYQAKPWKIAQQIDAESPRIFNEMLKDDLQHGVTMVYPLLKRGKSNKGICFDNLNDITDYFAGINFENIPILLDAYDCSLPIYKNFISAIKDTHDLKKVAGIIGMDPLGELVQVGSLPITVEKLYDDMTEVIAVSNSDTSNLRTVMVKGQPYHNGGANAVQELAFTLATAVEYMNQCLNRGLSIDVVASQMAFSYSIGANIFMEIAKLRAIKVLWSNVIQAYGGNNDSKKIAIHAQTSQFTKTVYDPYVNILRATTEAFAAIIGGVDSISVSPFDEAKNTSSAFSRRVARNVQHILKDETLIDKVVDPAGGSWYVESLTNEIAKKAWALFQEVEQLGGMYHAIEKGFVQEKVFETLSKRKKNLYTRKDKKVGTNFYANLKEGISEFTQTQVENKKTAYLTPIPQVRLTSEFETLRRASEKFKEIHGHFPRVGLFNLGSLSFHKTRADFITGFFEAGGFEVVSDSGSTVVDEIVEKYRPEISIYVICGTDEQYFEFVPKIAESLPNVKLFVAGKQPLDVENQFIAAGISGFIHMKSNCYELLKQLQHEMGVQG